MSKGIIRFKYSDGTAIRFVISHIAYFYASGKSLFVFAGELMEVPFATASLAEEAAEQISKSIRFPDGDFSFNTK